MNTRRFAAVVGAFCLCGCIVEAGVQGGARIAHEPEFSWGNHALAMVAPHPVRLGASRITSRRVIPQQRRGRGRWNGGEFADVRGAA